MKQGKTLQEHKEMSYTVFGHPRMCVGCGCTDDQACETEQGTCAWVEVSPILPLGVCTECRSMLGAFRILLERRRQYLEENHSVVGDLRHTDESLAIAAACYAAPYGLFRMRHGDPDAENIDAEIVPAWPESWGLQKDKRGRHSRMRQLAIAGALIAAEMDRLRLAGLDHD